MFNDESAPTTPESAPSAEPTPQMDPESVLEPGQPEQPVEATEVKNQDVPSTEPTPEMDQAPVPETRAAGAAG